MKIGSGLQQNSPAELKLHLGCTGSRVSRLGPVYTKRQSQATTKYASDASDTVLI